MIDTAYVKNSALVWFITTLLMIAGSLILRYDLTVTGVDTVRIAGTLLFFGLAIAIVTATSNVAYIIKLTKVN